MEMAQIDKAIPNGPFVRHAVAAFGEKPAGAMLRHTKIVCSRPGPTEAMTSFAPLNSAMAFK
jgi:hypothetical protein